MSSLERDPQARAAYSNNPQFTRGASERPDIIHLLKPEVAQAMSYLVELSDIFGKGKRIKDDDTDKFFEAKEIVEPYREGDPTSRFDRSFQGLSRSMEYKRKDLNTESDYILNERTRISNDLPVNRRPIIAFASSALLGKEDLGRRTKDLKEAYRTDPSILWTAFPPNEDSRVSNDPMKQRLSNLFMDVFSSFDFPDFDNPHLPQVLENIMFDYGAEPGNPTPQLRTYYAHEAKQQIGAGGVVLLKQFINRASKVKTSAGALNLINQANKFGLEQGGQGHAGPNMLLITRAFLTGAPDFFKSVFSTVPNTTINLDNIMKFRALYLRGVLQAPQDDYPYVSLMKAIEGGVVGNVANVVLDAGQTLKDYDVAYGTSFDKDYLESVPANFLRDRTKELQPWQYPKNLPVFLAANKERYLLSRKSFGRVDTVYTPFAAYPFSTARKGLNGIKSDFVDFDVSNELYHQGYWDTIARFMPGEYDTETYVVLRDQIEETKIDTYLNGDHFIAPNGDQVIIKDPILRASGFNSVTFNKYSKDKRYIKVTVDFCATNICCIVSPEYEMLDENLEDLDMLNNRTEPLQYLIFGYLRAIKCQRGVHQTSAPKEKNLEVRDDNMQCRRAHMRRLREGENPAQKQIDLALQLEDFDIIKDNKERTKKGNPKRTYVQQTVFDPDLTKPARNRAPIVEQKLKQITS